jgi:hypothetical protein
MAEALKAQQAPEITDEQFLSQPAEVLRQNNARLSTAMQEQVRNLKFELAEDLTRSLHADYDSVRDAFIAKVEAQDPFAVAIAQQMVNQPNPAKFVYDQARRIEQMSQIGDLDALTARIEAQVRAKVLAEIKGPVPAVEVPASLNSEPSAPSPSPRGGYEPTPLGSLLPNQF